MLIWTMKIIIFSIIFIFLIHNIINFLLETLTISKTKDMLQITNKNYKNIYDILSQNISNEIPQNETSQTKIKISINNDNSTLIDTLPNNILNNDDNMKNELTNYLRQQLNS
jgi:hypothetical protein